MKCRHFWRINKRGKNVTRWTQNLNFDLCYSQYFIDSMLFVNILYRAFLFTYSFSPLEQHHDNNNHYHHSIPSLLSFPYSDIFINITTILRCYTSFSKRSTRLQNSCNFLSYPRKKTKLTSTFRWLKNWPTLITRQQELRI